jgi:hypothetical protein
MVDLNLVHTGDVRPSQVIYELTSHLLLSRWRDANGEPQLHLFGQLKRIVKQWLDEKCLVCKGGTYPAQLKYKMLADMACERIMAGITRELIGKRPIHAVLDSYNPVGSSAHVRFNTSKSDRWETDSRRSQVNWVVLDSDWEAEFCRVAESHPRVRAYVKNHNLGLEVPYRYGSEMRRYLPDFIVLVEDGHGENDLLHLIVEIKGYRGEDAKEKSSTMKTCWVPGVNNLGTYGRWAFAEFKDIYKIESDFKKRVEFEFIKLLEEVSGRDFDGFSLPMTQAEREISLEFGPERRLLELWKVVRGSPIDSLTMSSFTRVADQSGCSFREALAVVSLLSSPRIAVLEFGLRSRTGDRNSVSTEKFLDQLTAWWRDKTLDDHAWKEWASSVEIEWKATTSKRVES